MTPTALRIVCGLGGLLCAIIVVGDLRRGSTRLSGFQVGRDRHPFVYWAMVLLMAAGGAGLLGGALADGAFR